ncbi:MAG: DUF4214 domain-containing protein [Vicinamibacteria bacterium]|nr:DUF4214 domain-containing protein [Vicinamibacteria bacterium]
MDCRRNTRRRVSVAQFLGVMTLLAAPVMAQPRWGRPVLPREGACFYRDTNFRGEYFCASTGEEISVVPARMNEEIASIRTFGSAEVTVFENGRFKGRSERFDGDVRDLQSEGWDDRLSSLRVMKRNSGDRGNGSRSGRGDSARGGGRSSEDPVRIVRRAYQDILDREPDAAGLRLYRSRIIDDDWSEQDVREALRKSPEFREKSTMTPQKAQEIVRRAYLAILEREPDAGSKGFVDNVLRKKWTQEDVERELRNSAEYRDKKR